MKKLLVLIVCLLAAKSLFAWGQKGHDVTAYIAECHLTPEAAAKVEKVLGGHSPVYYANWMDSASHQEAYGYTRTWHYLNIDEGETIETTKRDPNGDILTAVTMLKDKLSKGGLEAEDEEISLRMLIHLLGDLHCPLHTGHSTDRGGNLVSVKFFQTPMALHPVWDTNLPEAAHRWSYSEWQNQIDRLPDDEIMRIQAGEPKEWLEETHEICNQIYEQTPENTVISYDYIDRYTPVIEMQFLKGGYRLARLLNEIYQ